MLRIDPALFAELEAWAQQELRSVNGQVEFLLRAAVQRHKTGRSDPPKPELPDQRARGAEDERA